MIKAINSIFILLHIFDLNVILFQYIEYINLCHLRIIPIDIIKIKTMNVILKSKINLYHKIGAWFLNINGKKSKGTSYKSWHNKT